MYKWLLCSRYLSTRAIGLVSVLSVMLGVAVLIVVNSVMGGFREKMRDRLHGILSDMVLESTTLDGFAEPDRVMAKINEVAGDKIVAMTPAIEIFAMLNFQNRGRGPHFTRPVRLLGIDPVGRAKVGEYTKHLANPDDAAAPSFALRADALQWRQDHIDLLDPLVPTPEGCILGYQIATYRVKGMDSDELIIQPGQEVILTTVTSGKPRPVDCTFTVVDLYRSEMSEYDGNYVFVPLKQLQNIRGMGDAVTQIQIRLKDYDDAPEVIRRLEEAFPPMYFSVQTWEDKQGPLLHAVKVEAAILNIILFFIIIVAGFGILAIFFMIIMEKTRDIGTLKALGASDWGVMGVFLGYGLSLALVGCILGSVLGITFTLNINPIETAWTKLTGCEIFPRDVYYFKDIPAVLNPWTVVLVCLGSLVIAVGASVLPALRAARLRPVEALRYE